MKILAFIFIQLGGLLLYCAHASNIEPTLSPSIEHLFSPHVTISKDRKITEPSYIISPKEQFSPTTFGTNGAFNPIKMPFTVKGPSLVKYEIRTNSGVYYDCITNTISGSRGMDGITYKIDDKKFSRSLTFLMGRNGKNEHNFHVTFHPLSNDNFYINRLLKLGGKCFGKIPIYVQASGM